MPRGRPSKYLPEYIEKVAQLCDLGATDIEIADFFQIGIQTFHRWKHEHPEFRDAIKDHKEAFDKRVERSLYWRAVGYSYDAEKIVVNSKGEVTRVPYREHVPPDTAAAFIWLKNRQKEKWRDRHEVSVEGLELERFEPERLEELRQLLIGPPAPRLDS